MNKIKDFKRRVKTRIMIDKIKLIQDVLKPLGGELF